tara:strand:- start:8536 stop:9420 length:885 start_codon:yes stop_codon:yes gene_type:complete
MATRYWTNGAGTGVISTASNWTPSGAPSAGDTLIFAAAPTGATSTAVVGGNYLSLGDMAEVRIGTGFNAAFGSSSAYVVIEASSVILESGADVFLDVECAGASDKVVVGSTPFGADALHIRGDINELRILDAIGDVSVESTTTCTTSSGNTEVDTMYVFSRSEPTVTIETAVASMDELNVEGGSVECSAPVTTVNLYAGKHKQTSTGAITTLNVYNNSYATLEGSGTVTNLNMYGGNVKFRNNASDGITVTNCTLNSGTLDLQSSLRNVTFTNDILNKGGVLRPPLASTVALSY